MDVNLSGPAANKSLQSSWQVSTRDAGTLLHGGSTCKVAGDILRTETPFVSHFQNLHFLCENSCSLPKKPVYIYEASTVLTSDSIFSLGLRPEENLTLVLNTPSLTLNLKNLIFTFLRTNSFHPNKSISICSLS